MLGPSLRERCAGFPAGPGFLHPYYHLTRQGRVPRRLLLYQPKPWQVYPASAPEPMVLGAAQVGGGVGYDRLEGRGVQTDWRLHACQVHPGRHACIGAQQQDPGAAVHSGGPEPPLPPGNWGIHSEPRGLLPLLLSLLLFRHLRSPPSRPDRHPHYSAGLHFFAPCTQAPSPLPQHRPVCSRSSGGGGRRGGDGRVSTEVQCRVWRLLLLLRHGCLR
mmetsp:Transcript_30862/g.42756  ORF Transcript_30862/g.42756 Transcript_30862/m.42756 type:complete len:217 (-) Transcript_30862:1793-2443(-)